MRLNGVMTIHTFCFHLAYVYTSIVQLFPDITAVFVTYSNVKITAPIFMTVHLEVLHGVENA